MTQQQGRESADDEQKEVADRLNELSAYVQSEIDRFYSATTADIALVRSALLVAQRIDDDLKTSSSAADEGLYGPILINDYNRLRARSLRGRQRQLKSLVLELLMAFAIRQRLRVAGQDPSALVIGLSPRWIAALSAALRIRRNRTPIHMTEIALAAAAKARPSSGRSIRKHRGLNDSDQDILLALLKSNALNADLCQTEAQLGRGFPNGTPAHAMKRLKNLGFVNSSRGCTGGYWLTKQGLSRAKRIQTQRGRIM